MHLHCPERATEMEKEREEQGRSRVAGSLLWGGKNSDNIQATEQGHFSFQTTQREGNAHTREQIGPHWQSKPQLTASSNYNNGPSSVREEEEEEEERVLKEDVSVAGS